MRTFWRGTAISSSARTLLVIDNPVRKKTRSTDFFLQLFEGWQIEVDYQQQFRVGLTERRYTLVVYWQALPDLRDLPLLAGQNTVLVPMWDQVENLPAWEWLEFRHFRVLCFSAALQGRLKSLGMHTAFLRYFPELSWVDPEQKTNGLLFWRRQAKPDWSTVLSVVPNPGALQTIWYRDDLSAEEPRPSTGEVVRFHRTENRDEYVSLLDKTQYYFAARNSEGIGLSFLEAMARGAWVIAPNRPTMSEYIVEGQNGSLYDPDDPRPVRLPDRSALQACRTLAENLRTAFLSDWKSVNGWLLAPGARFRWTSKALVPAVQFAVLASARRVLWLLRGQASQAGASGGFRRVHLKSVRHKNKEPR